ncbi:MAG: hypothetical protein ACLVB1_00060 [Blautia obeum]
MERTEVLFMEAVKASLQNRRVSWEKPLTLKEWQRIFYLSEAHHVLPMVYEAVFCCESARKAEQKELRELFQLYRRKTLNLVMLQTIKTKEYLELVRCRKGNQILSQRDCLQRALSEPDTLPGMKILVGAKHRNVTKRFWNMVLTGKECRYRRRIDFYRKPGLRCIWKYIKVCLKSQKFMEF